MKKINLIIAVLMGVLTIACQPKNEDPTPNDPNGNGGGITNVLPVAKTIIEIPSNGSNSYTINASDFATDTDGLTLISISGVDNGFIVVNGGTATFTPPNKVYAGEDTINFSISDGKETINGSIILQCGTSKQIATYGGISSYCFGNTLNGTGTTLQITSDGKVSTSAINLPNFYGSNGINSGTWKINTNGEVELTPSGKPMRKHSWVGSINSSNVQVLKVRDYIVNINLEFTKL